MNRRGRDGASRGAKGVNSPLNSSRISDALRSPRLELRDENSMICASFFASSGETGSPSLPRRARRKAAARGWC